MFDVMHCFQKPMNHNQLAEFVCTKPLVQFFTQFKNSYRIVCIHERTNGKLFFKINFQPNHFLEQDDDKLANLTRKKQFNCKFPSNLKMFHKQWGICHLLYGTMDECAKSPSKTAISSAHYLKPVKEHSLHISDEIV